MRPAALALALLIAFGPLAAEARTTHEVRHYTVRGTTAQALWEAITFRSPLGASALTELQPSQFRWHARRSGRGYVVDTVQLDQHIVQVFPRWHDRDRARARPCVRQQWDRAMAALRAHEDRHRERFSDYAPRLIRQARSIPPQPSPAALERALNSLAARMQAEMRAWHQDYDRRTLNGQREGVVLRAC